jgi:hypothetical protein
MELAVVADLFDQPGFPGVDGSLVPEELLVDGPLRRQTADSMYARGLFELHDDPADASRRVASFGGPDSSILGAVLAAAATIRCLVMDRGLGERRSWYLRPEVAVQQRVGDLGVFEFTALPLDDVVHDLLAFFDLDDSAAAGSDSVEVDVTELWRQATSIPSIRSADEPTSPDAEDVRAVFHLQAVYGEDGEVVSNEVLWVIDHHDRRWLARPYEEDMTPLSKKVWFDEVGGRAIAERIVDALPG